MAKKRDSFPHPCGGSVIRDTKAKSSVCGGDVITSEAVENALKEKK